MACCDACTCGPDSIDLLEGDVKHLTTGLEAIAKPDESKWGGEIPLAVQKYAQEILDSRWKS